jgi:ubiquitin-protein ligase
MDASNRTSQRRLRVLQAAVKKNLAFDCDNLLIMPDPDDIGTWHVLAMFARESGKTPTPLAGGRFLFRMTALDTFPATPPKFTALVPNGVFTPNESLCVSIGVYHPGEWQRYKSMGMCGFAVNAILNGLVNPELIDDGIGILSTPDRTKKELAINSWEACQKVAPSVCRLLREYAIETSARPASRLFLTLDGTPISPDGSAGSPDDVELAVQKFLAWVAAMVRAP